jgi:type II secretory pathway pseudopilin PulG
MERIALRNNKGVSLIEVMISLLLLMVVSLAVLRTALVGVSTNLQNSMRDEAVNVVDLKINELRNTDFDVITLGTVTGPDISRHVRNTTVPYTPARRVESVDPNTKQITMSVGWTYRGADYRHSVTTIMMRRQ